MENRRAPDEIIAERASRASREDRDDGPGERRPSCELAQETAQELAAMVAASAGGTHASEIVTYDTAESGPSPEKLLAAARSELHDVFSLIVRTYLIFDIQARGYISRRELQAMLKEDKTKGQGGRRASFGPGSASSVTSLISEDRWNEMDWNRNGEIDFSDFVIGFSKWVVCDDEIEVGSPPSSQR